MNWSF